jgi:hypothetical protein
MLKKYFQDRPLSIPVISTPEVKEASQATSISSVRFEGMNKISGGRQLLEIRGNRMKRQVMNNFLEEKPDLLVDPIKEEP